MHEQKKNAPRNKGGKKTQKTDHSNSHGREKLDIRSTAGKTLPDAKKTKISAVGNPPVKISKNNAWGSIARNSPQQSRRAKDKTQERKQDLVKEQEKPRQRTF